MTYFLGSTCSIPFRRPLCSPPLSPSPAFHVTPGLVFELPSVCLLIPVVGAVFTPRARAPSRCFSLSATEPAFFLNALISKPHFAPEPVLAVLTHVDLFCLRPCPDLAVGVVCWASGMLLTLHLPRCAAFTLLAVFARLEECLKFSSWAFSRWFVWDDVQARQRRFLRTLSESI